MLFRTWKRQLLSGRKRRRRQCQRIQLSVDFLLIRQLALINDNREPDRERCIVDCAVLQIGKLAGADRRIVIVRTHIVWCIVEVRHDRIIGLIDREDTGCRILHDSIDVLSVFAGFNREVFLRAADGKGHIIAAIRVLKRNIHSVCDRFGRSKVELIGDLAVEVEDLAQDLLVHLKLIGLARSRILFNNRRFCAVVGRLIIRGIAAGRPAVAVGNDEACRELGYVDAACLLQVRCAARAESVVFVIRADVAICAVDICVHRAIGIDIGHRKARSACQLDLRLHIAIVVSTVVGNRNVCLLAVQRVIQIIAAGDLFHIDVDRIRGVGRSG